MDRLNAGDVLLMDGGTGSELQRRGVEVLTGVTPDSGLQAWSATANIDYADVVQQVHRDYLRVGADIIISNNFWTAPSRLRAIGLDERWEEYARAAAQNAIKTRDVANPEAYVAGGIATPSLQRRTGEHNRSDVQMMGAEEYRGEFADHARLLAEVGVDFMLPEYVGYIEDCVAAVDACAEAGLPVFLGVRHITEAGRMQYGEDLRDLAKALEGHKVDSVLLMCTSPEGSTAGLPILREAYSGPIGAYANIGYHPIAPIASPDNPDFMNVGNYTPSGLAESASGWKIAGAQIIGGCCSTGPEHVLAMRPVVKG